MSNAYGRSTEGFGMTRDESAALIVRTCLENGVTRPRQIAYILATAQHETRNFTAPEEDFGRVQARKLGYRGGEDYYGRGYVHLTHKDNYERMDRALGLQGALVRDPSLAKAPEVAARILVIGMRDGMFTGKKLADYVDHNSNDVYNARRTVNGVTASKPWSVKAARDCVTYTEAWEQRVPSLMEAARRDVVSPPSARPSRAETAPAVTSSAAILAEAQIHFLAGGNRFEYGRGDMRLRNGEGNGRTDASRTEQDLDGDGLKGVDCSSFVWRSLRNAGYDVGSSPFSTHALFNGRNVTAYSREHFDVIGGADARKANGPLQPGDVILFKDKDSGGQHVGIFKGYDANGGIRFVGSQVSTGPAEAGAAPGTYWNGRDFEIIGALRAKSEFQVRAPLHGAGQPAREQSPSQTTSESAPRPRADNGVLDQGDRGPAVARLQQRLADLGYRGADGRPLAADGTFGTDTRTAVRAFQLDHGLEGKGIVGPRTSTALDRASKALMNDPSHPHHALYRDVLEKVQAAEKAAGVTSGPHSRQIAAALAVECLREGLQRIDRVEINDTRTLVRAVQAGPGRDEAASAAPTRSAWRRRRTSPSPRAASRSTRSR